MPSEEFIKRPGGNALFDSLIEAHGDLSTITALVDLGADIRFAKDRLFQEVASLGKTETLAFLMKCGCDPHAVEDRALRLAAKHNQVETVIWLLAQGCNVHADHDCALRMASEKGHTAMTKALLAHHADPDKARTSRSSWANQGSVADAGVDRFLRQVAAEIESDRLQQRIAASIGADPTPQQGVPTL